MPWCETCQGYHHKTADCINLTPLQRLALVTGTVTIRGGVAALEDGTIINLLEGSGEKTQPILPTARTLPTIVGHNFRPNCISQARLSTPHTLALLFGVRLGPRSTYNLLLVLACLTCDAPRPRWCMALTAHTACDPISHHFGFSCVEGSAALTRRRWRGESEGIIVDRFGHETSTSCSELGRGIVYGDPLPVSILYKFSDGEPV